MIMPRLVCSFRFWLKISISVEISQ